MCALQINPGTVGFYRIQYSSSMLQSLLPGVRDLSLQPVDRLGLQNDLFSLVGPSQDVGNTQCGKGVCVCERCPALSLVQG